MSPQQLRLGMIAVGSRVETERLAAIAQLEDQVVLGHVVLAPGVPPRLRLAAVRRLEHPVMLAEVAKKDPDWEIRDLALRRINDQVVLAALVRDAPDSVAKGVAACRLRDPHLLAQIATSHQDEFVRLMALNALNGRAAPDQRVLTAALQDPGAPVRLEAVKLTNDVGGLARAARADANPFVREQAKQRLLSRDIQQAARQGGPLERLRAANPVGTVQQQEVSRCE